MSKRKLFLFFVVIAALIAAIGMPTTSSSNGNQTQSYGLIVGRNVNMVSGTEAPHGDPYLQRQNEPSVAVSTRNPMHLLAGANDYRTIDVPFQDVLPGMDENLAQIRDAWVGVFKSFNGGQSWISTLLPGYPQDTSTEGTSSPLYGYDFACDPTVRAGANGLFYYSGIAANRAERGAGVVFVSRYIDNNNSEFMDTIEYVDTNIADQGNSGQFLDMPYIAVDVPRSSGTVTIKGQEIPQSNVYITYSKFLGNNEKNIRSQILFARSTDCGQTWSKPIKLSESQHILQRPTIAIDPKDTTGRTIYVAFRRFFHGTQTRANIIVKSTDGGQTFTKPVEVTSFYPFDQGSSIFSFRTNSYPSLTVDGDGIVYLAWTQRMEPEGHARLVIATSADGLDWPSDQMKYVENFHEEEVVKGHQFMPSLTCAGGRLMLAWYDQRHDIAGNPENLGDAAFTPYIEDNLCRHTIDVRVAYGTLGLYPLFSPSRQVSRYLYTLYVDEYGEPIEDEYGYWIIDQAEFNPINFPLFQLGTTPFHGDWMEVAPSPWILPSSSGQWSFNTYPSQPTTSLMVWTDNRDVNPPGGSWWGSWQDYPEWPLYNAPYSVQEDPWKPPDCDYAFNTGMRNQNVYTANISDGLIVGSPQNTKQLDPDIQRTFVVYANNTTDLERYFQFRIDELGSATASFDQELYSYDHELNVTIAPFSSASVTVFVDPHSGENSTAVRIDVVEIDGSGIPINGLYGYVLLNPDPTNPDVIDYSDPTSPEYLGDEYHNPRVQGPRVWAYDLGNASELNPRVQAPRVQGFTPVNTGLINPRVQAEDPLNPRVQAPRVWAPRVQAPRVQAPRVQGLNILNQDIINPRVQAPRVQATALTDVTWPITNEGNTTSAYSFNVRSMFPEDFDEGKLIAQLLIYKVHTSPVSDGCELKQVHHDELVANIYNPRVQAPRVQAGAPTSSATIQSAGAWEIPEPTIYLEPNQMGYVTVRIWDDDTTDSIVFSPNNITIDMPAQAIDTVDEIEPEVGYPPGHGPDEWPAPAPKIWRSPDSMSFTAQEGGGNPASQTFQVKNIADGTTLNYTVTTDAPWLTVFPSDWSLDYNESYTHTVSADTSGLSAGTYTGNIAIYDPFYEASNNPQFVRVKLYVTSTTTTPTQVKLTGPTWVQAGEISKAFTLISLDSDANPINVQANTTFILSSTSEGIATFYSDPGGSSDITQVTIASGSSSAKFYYKDTEAGNHTITATDSNPPGLGSASHPISVIISAAEYLKVTGNSTVTAGDIKELTITAYDKYDNVAIGYSGPKFLTFSGPGDAPDGTKPTVEDAYIGSTIIVNFTEGVSDPGAATLIAYNAELTLINVSDGLIDSFAHPSYGFDLTVDPADFDPNESSVSNVYPSPATAGDTVTIEITTYDEFQNLRTVGGDTVNISITNGHTIVIPSPAFDNGIYSATPMLTVSGIDEINASINGSPTARDADGTSDGTYHLTINPGNANYFKVTGNSTMDAGGSQSITITAYDQYDNVATGYDGSKTLTFSGASSSPSPATSPTCDETNFGIGTTVTFSAGVGTSTMKLHKAEEAHIKAAEGSLTTSNDNDLDVTVSPATKNKLLWVTQPSTPAVAGASWDPFSIEITDQYGNRTADTDSVTVLPSVGSFGGTTARTAVAGLATFDDITYSTALTITATGSSIDVPTDTSASGSVVVDPAAANYFKVTGNSTMDAGGSQSITITAYDQYDNVATGYDGSKTLTFSGASSSPSPATSPTCDETNFGIGTTVTFSAGVGTSTMELYMAEEAHIKAAEGTITTSDDNDLDVTVSPAPKNKLLWVTQPSSPAVAGAPWDPFSIEITDPYGNRTDDTDSVTVLPLVGSFGGTTARTATAGLATFDDITYNTALPITVTGSSPDVTDTSASGSVVVDPAAANYFKVTGNSTMDAGGSQSITITAYDQYDNVATGYDGPKTLTFSGASSSPSPATSPTCDETNFGSGTAVTFSAGVGTSTMKLYMAEEAHIKAAEGTITTSDDNDLDVTVSPAPKNKLLWVTQPSTPAVAGAPWDPFSIEITDQYGNRTADTDIVTVLPLVGSFGGTTARTATAGLATFDDITYNTAATITVTGSSIAVTDTSASGSVVVDPAAANYFKVTGNSTVTAGGSKELTITAFDEYDNVATGYAGPKNLIFSGPGIAPDGTVPTVAGADVGTTTSVNFTDGVSDTGAATLVVYKAETISVDVTDGTINSFADPSYDIDLTVEAGALASIKLSPETSTITAGDSQTYTVEAFDGYNNRLGELNPYMTSYSIDAGAGGSWAANVYTSEFAGEWTVTAAHGYGESKITDTASLIVEAGDLASFTVDAPASGTAGTSFSVTVTAKDSKGNTTTNVTLNTTLEVDSGTISPDIISVADFTDDGVWTGDVTLSAAGSRIIAASNNGKSGSDTIEILIPQYTLNVNKDGNGTGGVSSDPAGINCGVDCSEAYDSGTQVRLTAQADEGSAFVGWSGDIPEGQELANPLDISMDKNKTVTARFNLTYIITALTSGTGSGTITPSGDVSVPYGQNKTFTIEAGPGSYIQGVTVNGVGQGPLTEYTFESVTTNHRIEAVINLEPFVITTTSIPNETVGTYYSTTISHTGGVPPFDWDIVPGSGTLPAGLELGPESGYILGTPTEAGSFSFTVRVMDNLNQEATQPLSIMITPGPLANIKIVDAEGAGANEIGAHTMTTSDTLYLWAAGYDEYGNFRQNFQVTWTRTGTLDPLPPLSPIENITFSPSTAPTSGTIEADYQGAHTDATGTITVNVGPLDHFEFSPIGNKRAQLPFSVTITAKDVGGNTVTSHAGPNDLSLTQPGTITPTNTGTFTNGVWTGDVTIGTTHTGVQIQTSGDSKSGTSNSFDVLPPVLLIITEPPLPSGVEGQAYGPVTLEASGGIPPYNWWSNTMPEGLDLSSEGVIDGTPTASGTLHFGVYCEDGTQTIQKDLSVYLAPELVITTTTVPDAINGESYSATLEAAGGIPPYVWDVQGLPTGFTFTEAGEIDGTPNYPAGPYVFLVIVEDSGDAETKQTTYTELVMTIIDHTVSTPNTPDGPTWGITNVPYTYDTGGATCSVAGHNVEYRFDWGDGSGYSGWLSSPSSSHAYTNVGSYSVKAQARCSHATGIISSWSSGFTLNILPTLSGKVTHNSTGLEGVEVYSVNYEAGGYTDENGEYSFPVRIGYDGQVVATYPGYRFEPVMREYLDVTSDQTDQDYTAIRIWSITGKVTVGGSGLAGVVMAGLPEEPKTSLPNGQYWGIVDEGWSGTVTPTLAGYSFSPSSLPYSTVNSPQTDQDYTATLIITHTITASAGSGGSISPSGAVVVNQGASQTFDFYPDANYHVANVVVDSVSQGAPTSYTFTDVETNHTISVTFAIDTYTIKGMVLRSGVFGVQGVVMSGLPGSPTTDIGGKYTGIVNYGWAGTVTPTMTGYTFSPTSRTYDPVYDNIMGDNYQATLHTVSTPTPPTIPSNAVTNTVYMFSTGGSTCSGGDSVEYQFDWGDGTQNSPWSSSASATHSYSNPGIYTVRTQARCSVLTDVVSGWSSSTLTIHPTISGTVNDQFGNPMAGVQVTTLNHAWGEQTDVNGRYRFLVPYNQYVDAIEAEGGYGFSPSYHLIETNVTSNITGKDFTCTILRTISGNAGVEGVTISFSNGGGVATSLAGGGYTHTVNHGWTGTATPTKTGYTFNPAQRVYSTPVSGNISGQDFTATLVIPQLISPVAGAVLDNGCNSASNPTEWDFDWSDISGATLYNLYVKKDTALNPVINVNVGTSSYHYSDASGWFPNDGLTGWTWKVNAYVNGAWQGWSEARSFSIEPVNTDCPLTITTTTPLPDGVLDVSYSETLNATGGTPPYTWVKDSGDLPVNLGLSASGVISGTPGDIGTSTFRVYVQDSAQQRVYGHLDITIYPQLFISTTFPLYGWAGTWFSETLQASGGTGSYSWSVAPGFSLPPRFTLTSNGVLSGPLGPPGTLNIAVRVVDTASPRQSAIRISWIVIQDW